MKRVVINDFAEGITNDPRDKRSSVARSIQHFDVFSRARKLTPLRSYESGDSSASANKIANFCMVGSTLYGLGTANGSPDIPKLFTKTDFSNSTWSADAGGYSISGAARATADLPLFEYYPNQNEIYGVRAGRYVYSVVPGTSVNTTEADLTSFSTVSNGLVHSKDDIFYFGYDNKIASKNGAAAFTVAALTLPVGTIITSICEYGNYLAIGTRSSNGGRSKVYLWDRDSSLTTVSESIDWGEGDLMVLEELGGYLLGISHQNSSNYFKSVIVARQYTGAGGAERIGQINSTSSLGTVANFKQKVNGRILFPMKVQIDGTNNIYCTAAIGRVNSGRPFSISFENLTANDSSAGDGVNVQYGIYRIGDYLFNTYVDNAAAYVMTKTDDQANYTASSVYETIINQGMDDTDKALKKQLVSVGLNYESLPGVGQAILKYKVDGGSWNTVFTETTDSAMASEFTKAGSTEFTSGREYEFRIESTGGAEITGLFYKYNVLTTNI